MPAATEYGSYGIDIYILGAQADTSLIPCDGLHRKSHINALNTTSVIDVAARVFARIFQDIFRKGYSGYTTAFKEFYLL